MVRHTPQALLNRTFAALAATAAVVVPLGLVVTAGPSDLVARLYASGAWLAVDARFARGCTPRPAL